MRAVGFLFGMGLGKEAMGLGDADLMMMAGAFLGWQVVVVAFLLSVVPALMIGFIQLAVRHDNALAFGPSLSIGVMAACLAWRLDRPRSALAADPVQLAVDGPAARRQRRNAADLELHDAARPGIGR